jgi:hypothetical protein
MADIFDGYGRLARMIEARPSTPDVDSAPEITAMTLYRTRAKLLDNIDGWLAPLEIKARHAAEKTDDALKTVDEVYGHIMAARGEAITNWDSFRVSRVLLCLIPWTTAAKIEKEHLQADLEITKVSLVALQEGQKDLTDLAEDLAAYRETVRVARDGLGERMDGENEALVVLELMKRVEYGRKETRAQ